MEAAALENAASVHGAMEKLQIIQNQGPIVEQLNNLLLGEPHTFAHAYLHICIHTITQLKVSSLYVCVCLCVCVCLRTSSDMLLLEFGLYKEAAIAKLRAHICVGFCGCGCSCVHVCVCAPLNKH